MARRGLQEINAGSMADIAFLLLIFFLVTTTMDQDIGILRQLPPPVPDDMEKPPEVKQRNVYEVLVNSNDQLLVEGQRMDIRDLKAGAIEFYTNPSQSPDLPQLTRVSRTVVQDNLNKLRQALSEDPENKEIKDKIETWEDKLIAIELIGDYSELPSSALISLQNDRGTSYDMYISVQNELSAGVNELRNTLSEEKFGVPYSALNTSDDNDKPKIKAIRAVYPQRISEAEPKDLGTN
ncbi:biopolymer transporter ExbD [Cryomorpha ignava]|uniref:Biopolymer transporter ExbD n=1 Tax=Cryomorpha ignava TaxID=101383 RepID=A0A7K3WQB9_9FLAO|nr:biopolymer transporter ExbD [Cryomorpha ignava]NEN23853.1 biopolymer transporter ExbD [Cryomorpha ignava]